MIGSSWLSNACNSAGVTPSAAATPAFPPAQSRGGCRHARGGRSGGGGCRGRAGRKVPEEVLPYHRIAKLPHHPIGEVVVDVKEGEEGHAHHLAGTPAQPVGHHRHRSGGNQHRHHHRDGEQDRDEQRHVPGETGRTPVLPAHGAVYLDPDREHHVLDRMRDLHPEDRERILAQVEDTIANRTPYLIEYRIIRPDNEVRWIEARGQMFLGADGQPERVVGICMDITERKRVEATLLEAERVSRERAEELTHLTDVLRRMNAELDAFAYAASHDLRAPLRGIANLAQWIEEDLGASGELKSETSEMLGLMRSRMHRMEALIEGILQYSRAGRVDSKVEHVDTHRLVKEVVDLLSAPGATIEITNLPTLETTLLPLQQVFMNLIGNALKYADRPDPVVRVTARDDGRFYEFSVSDNGPGIPAEYHTRIWGIFQSLEARDKVEATGIGLSLVKKLVEANGGRAWVESAPGQGATFRFLWPKQIRGSIGS